MFLEKDGIRVEVLSPIDVARLKSLGYREATDAAEPVKADSAEQANADAVKAVNESDSGSKTKISKK